MFFFFLFDCLESKAVAVNLHRTFWCEDPLQILGEFFTAVTHPWKWQNAVIKVHSLRSCSVLSTTTPPPSSPTTTTHRPVPHSRLPLWRERDPEWCQRVSTGGNQEEINTFSSNCHSAVQSRWTAVWLKLLTVCARKVATVTASRTCTDIHAAPARTDISCFRKIITLVAKVGLWTVCISQNNTRVQKPDLLLFFGFTTCNALGCKMLRYGNKILFRKLSNKQILLCWWVSL